MSTKGKGKGAGADPAAELARIHARDAARAARHWRSADVVLHNVPLSKPLAQALDRVWRHFGCATRAEAVRRCIEVAAAGLDTAKK